MSDRDKKSIGIWLLTGVLMIYVQVVIGGITRLTGSGLSITRWEIVTGTLPPLGEDAWEKEFSRYKASPQYRKVNTGMSLGEFRQIYFWEYFHRLWARTLGFVFLLPFAWFLIKKKFTRELIKKAIVAFALGALVGVFGWIMVASGLQDRPSVSPYKLALHLSLAILTLGYLLWVTLGLLVPAGRSISGRHRGLLRALTVMVCAQIVVGAIVSGMHAAVFYPTWPDMNGEYFPSFLLDAKNWHWNSFIHFEQYSLAPALFQFVHRMTGYAIFIMALLLLAGNFRLDAATRKASLLLNALIVVQVLLGIFTLLASRTGIPVGLGVLHQATGIALLLWLLIMNFLSRERLSGLVPQQVFTEVTEVHA